MQEIKVVFLTSYELIMSLIFAMVTIYFATKFMNKFVLSAPVEEFIKKRHKSGCLISASLICSVLYLVQGSIEHSTLALQSLMIAHKEFSIEILGIAFGYFIIFYIVTFLTSFILIFIISKIYRKMMEEIDFDDEIEKHDNLGLSLFLSFVLLGIVLFIDKPINHFLGSLVFHEWLEKL
ncbi:MAG: hypothetical protein HN576_06060 [Bacteriovoracaceae bacterium]|jgi:hypothetical protein|nr:hypothetical protein [Bacteriovoracaceae bacterium]